MTKPELTTEYIGKKELRNGAKSQTSVSIVSTNYPKRQHQRLPNSHSPSPSPILYTLSLSFIQSSIRASRLNRRAGNFFKVRQNLTSLCYFSVLRIWEATLAFSSRSVHFVIGVSMLRFESCENARYYRLRSTVSRSSSCIARRSKSFWFRRFVVRVRSGDFVYWRF